MQICGHDALLYFPLFSPPVVKVLVFPLDWNRLMLMSQTAQLKMLFHEQIKYNCISSLEKKQILSLHLSSGSTLVLRDVLARPATSQLVGGQVPCMRENSLLLWKIWCVLL